MGRLKVEVIGSDRGSRQCHLPANYFNELPNVCHVLKTVLQHNKVPQWSCTAVGTSHIRLFISELFRLSVLVQLHDCLIVSWRAFNLSQKDMSLDKVWQVRSDLIRHMVQLGTFEYCIQVFEAQPLRLFNEEIN